MATKKTMKAAGEMAGTLAELLKQLGDEKQRTKALIQGLKDARDYLKSAGHKNAVAEADAALNNATKPPKVNRDWYRWVVEVEVHKTWVEVEDGFDFSSFNGFTGDGAAHERIRSLAPHAFSHEVRAKILEAPAAERIRIVQGGKPSKAGR